MFESGAIFRSSAKFLREFSPSPFDDRQSGFQLPGFLVDVGQLLFELLPVKVVRAAFLLDQGLDFVPYRRNQGLPCMLLFPVLQLASPDGGTDFLLR